MKVQFVAACLLGTLAMGARAESPPPSEAPVAPSPPPTPPEVPLPRSLDAQRQRLEAHREALAAQQRELEADIQQLESEARLLDPEGRLNPDQLFTLLQERERLRADDVRFDPSPIVISVALFSSLLTGFLAWLFASYRRQRQIHETVRLMVEKGAEIPTGLLAPAPRKPSDLRRGIILSTAGLGLAIFLAVLPDAPGTWGAGVTLLLIGVGHLLVWRLQGGKGSWSSALASEPQP